jgi:parallel beta-helix repeat protein
MSRSIRLANAAAFFLALCLAAPQVAHAAESYDNCTGFITSLPTVISTQGTWCMKSDQTTAVTSGNAITVTTNNVTIDCNNFKLGGLGAGLGTTTAGIFTQDHLNVTVRNCNIRGFWYGIYFAGSSGGGHVVEDNRFDGNTYCGIRVQGDGSLLQRNRVSDTGGSTGGSQDTTPIWIEDSVDLRDNTVTNSVAGGTNNYAYGIYSNGNLTGRIIGNGVSGVVKTGSGHTYGILLQNSDRVTLRNNDVIGDGSTGNFGIACASANGRAMDNIINGFPTGLGSCSNDGGNVIAP